MLQQAAICDGVLADREPLDAESVHWLSEAARRGFRDRFARCGSDTDAWAQGLSPTAVAQAREEISGRVRLPPRHGTATATPPRR